MTLSNRVKKLEQRLGPKGRRTCRCKGALPPCGVFYGDEPPPEVREAMCPACGGVLEPLLVHVVYRRRMVGQNKCLAAQTPARCDAVKQRKRIRGPGKSPRARPRTVPRPEDRGDERLRRWRTARGPS